MSEEDLYFWYKGMYMSVHLHGDVDCQKRNSEITFQKDDVIIVTYPKSGTSWMKEIVPLILTGGDVASVESSVSWQRVPWLEFKSTGDFSKLPALRVFCTHYLYNMMPPSFYEVKPKVIYVMRNVKDIFTSYLHYSAGANYMVSPGPQHEFLQLFLEGRVCHGSWFDNVKSWLSVEDKSHIMYIFYEEMLLDLKDSVTRISQFLEKPLDDEVIEKITDKCLFKNMKQNNMSNYKALPVEAWDWTKSDFLRKGITGDWKNQLTVAESEYIDTVYKFKMRDINYEFPWNKSL